MEKDNYIISDGEKKYEIYPLLEVEMNNSKYLVYTNKIEPKEIKNIFIGKINGEEITPAEESVIEYFKENIDTIMKEIEARSNN